MTSQATRRRRRCRRRIASPSAWISSTGTTAVSTAGTASVSSSVSSSSGAGSACSRVSPSLASGGPSAISNATTVMLSWPPPRFAPRRAPARAVEVVAVPLDDGEDRVVVDHVGQAVGAEHEDVAGLGGDGERVDVDVRIGAERARDHRALRVVLGLLAARACPLRTSSATSEWSSVSCSSCAVADQVGARVADVAERDAVVLRRARRSSSCPSRTCGSLARARRRRGGSPPGSASTTRSSPRAVRLGLLQRSALRRAATRPRRPARRPSRPRSRTAAARRRRRPRCAGAVAPPVSVERLQLSRPTDAHVARTSGPSRRRGRRRPGASLRGRSSRAPFTIGAVRRADVLDPDAVAPRLEARVAARRRTRRVDGDVVLPAAADRERRRVELEVLAARRAPGSSRRRARPVAALRRGASSPPGLDGARMKLSCGTRRSRLAVRTMRQMKR